MAGLDYSMSPELSLAMMSSAGADGLLPNLHTLSWPCSDGVFPLCRLGARLRDLSLSLGIQPPTFMAQSILGSLPSECPKVQELTLSHGPRIGPFATKLACGWAHLETLRFGAIDIRDLLHISCRLNGLRQLQFIWNEDTVLEYLHGAQPGYLQFPQLRALMSTICETDHQEAHALAIVDTFIRTLDAPELNDIRFTISWNASSESLSRSVLTSVGELNHSSATAVIVEMDCCDLDLNDVIRNPDHAICLRTMQPIFSCRDLTTFHWDCLDGFDLDDGGLATLASSWPSLQSLTLSCVCGWSIPSRITLQGLVNLLQLCPHLKQLGIVVNATEVEVSTGQITPNTRLESITLGNSPITDAVAVASVLSCVLPRLSDISSWDTWVRVAFDDDAEDEAERYQARWGEVEQLLLKQQGNRTAEGRPLRSRWA